MKGVTFLIEKLVTTTYKKLGINGILLLLIFIAIPASLFYTDYNGPDYHFTTNYTLRVVTEPEKVAEKDVPPAIDRFADDYYTVSLQIDNYYSKELNLPYLSAFQEDEDNFISFRDYDYYDDIKGYDVTSPDTCIPAGTGITLPYYFSGYELTDTDLTIRPYEDKEVNEENTVLLKLD